MRPIIVIAVAAATVAGTVALGLTSVRGDSPEPAFSPSAEIRQLTDRRDGCPFDRLSAIALQTEPQALSPSSPNSGCGYLEQDGVRIERFTHRGPHGSYRLEYVKRRGDTPHRFVIFLTGGPRLMTLAIGPAPFRIHLPVQLAQRGGTGVLAPAYLGTWTRSFFPAVDVDAAAEEVGSLMEQLRLIDSRVEISVVAASAGGLVALRLLTHHAVPTVLVSPSPTSLRDLITDPGGTDVPADASRQLVRFYRYRPGTQDLEQTTATAAEEVSAFAGAHYDRSLADLITLLPPRRRGCLAIAYGPQDRRVRISRLSEVRSLFPTIATAPVNGMGHVQANETQAAELARIVVEITPTRCS